MKTTDLPTQELVAEILDASQTLASLVGSPGTTHETKHDGHFWTREREANQQRNRSLESYGPRAGWPVGSSHAMASTERELDALRDRIKDTTAYLNEMLDELKRREVWL